MGGRERAREKEWGDGGGGERRGCQPNEDSLAGDVRPKEKETNTDKKNSNKFKPWDLFTNRVVREYVLLCQSATHYPPTSLAL